MRESTWRVVWDPLGVAPRVLLDYGDFITEEVAVPLSQLVDTGRPDFAVSGRPYGRGNARRRFQFERLHEFGSLVTCLQQMVSAARDDLWGVKSLLHVIPLDGGPRVFRAAYLAVTRQIYLENIDPAFTTRHEIRIDNGLIATGPGSTIIGGYYRPPVVGGGTNSGGIIVTVPPGSGIGPGDWVEVGGVPGVPPGTYPVDGIGGGDQLSIGAPSNKLPRASAEVAGAGPFGTVRFHHPGSKVYVNECKDTVATYQVGIPGSWTTIHPNTFGRAEVNLGDFVSQITYSSWWEGLLLPGQSPTPDPLPLAGSSIPRPGGIITQGMLNDELTLQLRKNGTVIDEQVVKLSIFANKTYLAGGPNEHDVTPGGGVVFTLNGNGSDARRDPGVPVVIPSGGTITKVV